jgi:hypothetical protein
VIGGLAGLFAFPRLVGMLKTAKPASLPVVLRKRGLIKVAMPEPHQR